MLAISENIVLLLFSPCKNESCSVLRWTQYSQPPGDPGTADLTHLPHIAPLKSGVSGTEMALEAVTKASLLEKTALTRWSWSSQWF